MRKISARLAVPIAVVLAFSLAAMAAVRKGPYLIYGGDPAQMTVLWQLDTSQTCTIRWGLDSSYSSGAAEVQPHGDTQYEYTITGLLPGTLYHYEVEGVGSGSLTTAPDSAAANVKLLAFGDPAGSPDGYDGACARMIDSFTRDPSFQTLSICAGDWASEDETVWDTQYFARAWENILYFLARVPVAGPRGNHESPGTLFKKYFPFPYVSDFYWSFDYGPVHIIVLDQFVSYAPGSPQYEWLVSDLAATSKPWKIITFHKPGWSAGVHENNLQVQEYIQPLCLQYGIDLVISGHNHYYARADVGGVQHLTTGGGGYAVYTPVGGDYIVISEAVLHHLEIDIQGREASVAARRRDGSVIETFTINHGASVRIISPQSGSTLLVGQATNVQARVLPAGGTCTGVDFYADGRLIGTDDTEPYEVIWAPPSSPSSVSLVAKAFIYYAASTETIESAPVTVNVTNTPPPQSLDIRVSQSSDDAEESASGRMYLTSSDLELVYDSSTQKVGMRFNGIVIPQGAEIRNAYVQFKVDENTDINPCSLTIHGESADQAATFASSGGDISSRTRTVAAMPWSPSAWPTVGAAGIAQRTPDIAPVIQEIVNRERWASGNSLAIIITGIGRRLAEAYDGDASGAPLLHIEFLTNSGNHAPVALGDAYSVDEDSSLIVGAPGVLGNDLDQEGSLLKAALDGGPSHGSLTLNPSGGFTYTPATNYFGSDTFTYHANDGSLNSNSGTVTITVNPVNDAPVANDQSVSTAEDTAKAITLTGSDAENNPLTYAVVSQPSHGSLSGTAPYLIYKPQKAYSGSDSFTFKVNDGALDSGPATVSITVTAVNDPPVAVNDTYSTSENTPLTVSAPGVLANDTDPESSALTAVLNVGPSNGNVTLNSDGSFTYTPNANYSGSDTFTYHANDGNADSNIATVTINVSTVNHAPVAVNDAYSTNEDTPLNVAGPGVLSNDTDQENNPLTAALNTGPSKGSLTLNANGSFTYTPNPNSFGADSFTYYANDGSTNSNIATVAITVYAVNDPPVAVNDAYSTSEDTPLTIAGPGVLSNDTDQENNPLTAVLNAGPSHGSLTLNTNGSFSYSPGANYNGLDSFSYRANDGIVNSEVATVSITVTPVNAPPVAVNDSFSTSQNVPLTISAPGVLANDVDPDSGTTLTALKTGSPANGTVTLNADGSFKYAPNATFTGTDSFTYYASDGSLNSNTATVTITVQSAVNQAPVVNAGPDRVIVLPTLSVTLMGSATDDGLPKPPGMLTVTWSKASGSGTVTFGSPSSASTTATFSKGGSYTLRLTAFDGDLTSSDTVVVSVRKK